MIELCPILAISLEDVCWLAFIGYMVFSSVFGSKKKPEEEEQAWEGEEQATSAPDQQSQPVARTEGKAPDLERELQRLFGVKVAEPEPVSYEEESAPEPELVSRIDLSPAPVSEPSPHLAAAQDAYTQASHLHERVAERMEDVDERVKDHSVGWGAREDLTSQDIADAVAMVRRPDTARQAIIASVILAPPKALEG